MQGTEQAAAFNLLPGQIRVGRESGLVRTVLGSCVAVCLWDPLVRTGGLNHYLLPLWNGEGLPSPRYGNVAIGKLLERLLGAGCRRERLQAKVFGGAARLETSEVALQIGERNVGIAAELLGREGIPIVARDVGGRLTRTLLFNIAAGTVRVRRIGLPGG